VFFATTLFAALNAELVVDNAYSIAQARAGVALLRAMGYSATGEIDVAQLGGDAEDLINGHPMLRLATKTVVLHMKYNGQGVFFTRRDASFWAHWCDQLDAELDRIES